MLNSASKVCSDEFGTLEWATQQCEKDVNCNWLHDHSGDNKNWRLCPNVNIYDYLSNAPEDEIGMSKLKPSKDYHNSLDFFNYQLRKNE